MQQALLNNKVHMRSDALQIAECASLNAKHFEELMQCFLSGDYRLAQRAAWSVSWAAKKHPDIIRPYIPVLVKQLKRKDVHTAILRNSLRVLQNVEVPENLHGELMTSCFNLIEEHKTPVAIKAFALTVLFNLSKIYVDVLPELTLIINKRMEHETAAFNSRAKKILEANQKQQNHKCQP